MRKLFAVSCAAVVLTAGCVFWKTDVKPVGRPAASQGPTVIKSPLKVHLRDGSTIVYRQGAIVTRDSIAASGEQFAFLSATGTARGAVSMDSVVGVETFEKKVLAAPTVVASAAGAAVGVLAGGLLAIAIFGSCPTIYSDSGTGLALEAEGFSYAIAPLMEHRDVDPLRVRADSRGVVRLELRNEALETHFLNHIELLSVRHTPGTPVVPDQAGRPVVLSGFATLARATDRAGRDVRAELASRDGRLFTSAPSTIKAARVGDLEDWIELDVAGLPAGDSVAVVMRLRNSLLNTVLLYEGILGGRDAADWLHNGLQHIASAVDLSRWYVRTMGMRASVEGVTPADPSLGLARLGDTGPVAFRDVALVLPRSAVDARTARVRLRFVADNWRIDEVRVAGTINRPSFERLAVAQVVVPVPATGSGPMMDTAAVRALTDADDRYLETRPGQRMTLEFQSSASHRAGSDSTSTYLIAWQGWYREWIRGSWLASPTRTTPFVPGDSAVLAALHRWTDRKASFEREFYASKIPVR